MDSIAYPAVFDQRYGIDNGITHPDL